MPEVKNSPVDSPEAQESSEFVMPSFNEDIVNTDNPLDVDVPNEDVSDDVSEEKSEESETPTESSSDEETQEVEGEKKPEGEIDTSAEDRIKAAQAKMHEATERAAALEKQLNDVRGNMSEKQTKVFDAILENIQKQNAPATPTAEDVRKQFEEAAEKDPFDAIMLAVNHATQTANTRGDEKLEGMLGKFKEEITGIFKQGTIEEKVENNLQAMASTDKAFTENFDSFRDHLHAQFSVIPDEAQRLGCIKAICANPTELKRRYDSFLVLHKGTEARAAIDAAAEAKIAEKLSQAQDGSQAAPAKKKKSKDMFIEDMSPGFAGYFE